MIQRISFYKYPYKDPMNLIYIVVIHALIKRHNSLQMEVQLWFRFCAYDLIKLPVCTKFHENTFRFRIFIWNSIFKQWRSHQIAYI